MKNTSAVMNKLPVLICAVCLLFFAAMLAWYFMIPHENYTLSLDLAQSQAQNAQDSLNQRLETANAGLAEQTALHDTLSQEVTQLQQTHGEKAEAVAALQAQVDEIHALPETILQVRTTYGEKARLLEEMVMSGQTDLKICYLTLDDGPNNLTASIVERLAELDIQATFFTIGANDAGHQEENLRAEMMGGHTIANHTYSHAYNGSLYRSFDEFKKQVQKQDEFVFNATGFHTDIFRFPSGSVACPFFDSAEAWLHENGYQWADWNANAYDAGLHAMDDPSYVVNARMLHSCKDKDIVVILCHDFNYGTYGALNTFVPEMQAQGYVFLPLLPQSHVFDEPLPVV